MTRRDDYYNRAKQEGYRSRSAYKLQQLDDLESIFDRGDTVLDLGAAPGGWMQVAADAVGPEGTVIGVDLQRIDSFDEYDTIETIRGDITDERTRARIEDAADGGVDCVISDMAPNMTGEYSLDQARSLHLARTAYEVSLEVLAGGGYLVVKVFDGPDVDAFREEMEGDFRYVRATSPEASRGSSSELYLIGAERLTTPVDPGDVLDVKIVDEGDRGDGIAQVDGFSLFVDGTSPGETVTVRVEDVKPQFGFASRVDTTSDE